MDIVNYDKIKELAARKNISLERLANSAGFGKSTMYNYINKTYQIKISELYRISRILDVNIGELLNVPVDLEDFHAEEPIKEYGGSCIDCIKKQGGIDHLKETLKEKEERIGELEDLCKEYKINKNKNSG